MFILRPLLPVGLMFSVVAHSVLMPALQGGMAALAGWRMPCAGQVGGEGPLFLALSSPLPPITSRLR